MRYSWRYKWFAFLKKLGINYDARENSSVQKMLAEIDKLPGRGIKFAVVRDADGEWSAESTNLKGIITGGGPNDDMEAMVKDAIFAYFAIPPQFCDETLIRLPGEFKPVKQNVLATA